VITTRLPVADIADHEGTSALLRELEQLSGEAGAKLVRSCFERWALKEKKHSCEVLATSSVATVSL
jgi:hypothetical protein